MLASKSGRIRHKIILRDNFHGIKKRQTEKELGYTFTDDTWFDFCEYLNDCVRIEVGDILVESIINNNAILLHQYAEDHDIVTSGLMCSLKTAKLIVREIAQDTLDKFTILWCITGNFRTILEYLTIKYAKEYITQMELDKN